MKIALASQNRLSVTPHAGKCRHFFIVDTCEGFAPKPVILDLQQMLSVWQGEGPHPLDGVAVLIAGSMGLGVAENLARRRIRAVVTNERDLQQAVSRLLDASLAESTLRADSGSCRCHS